MSDPADLARELTIDFVGGAVGHRHRFGGGRGQDLPRAAGFAKGFTPTIVDATAGLGRDAFLLASLGAEITLIERSPHVHARLAEAIAAARQADPATAQAAGRMTLLLGDARELLRRDARRRGLKRAGGLIVSGFLGSLALWEIALLWAVIAADITESQTTGVFDAIVFCGGVAQLPTAWAQRLKDGGRLVAILGQDPMMRTTVLTRHSETHNSQTQPWDTLAPYLRGFEPAPSFAL